AKSLQPICNLFLSPERGSHGPGTALKSPIRRGGEIKREGGACGRTRARRRGNQVPKPIPKPLPIHQKSLTAVRTTNAWTAARLVQSFHEEAAPCSCDIHSLMDSVAGTFQPVDTPRRFGVGVPGLHLPRDPNRAVPPDAVDTPTAACPALPL